MFDCYKTILNYLYESNKIPIWIFSDKELVYSSLSPSDLRDDGKDNAFFNAVLKQNTDKPVVHSVGGGEKNELFTSFRFQASEKKTLDFIAGPVFSFDPVQSGYKKRFIADYLYKKESFRKRVTDTPIVGLDAFCRFVQAVSALLKDVIPDVESLKANCIGDDGEKLLESALGKAIYEIREDELISLYTMESERTLVEAVKEGDISKILDDSGRLRFHGDRMRAPIALKTEHQFEYEVVALVTLVTRAAVEGGLDIDTAFSLSDLYLHRIDNSKTARELEELSLHAVRTFCEKVAESKSAGQSKYSPRIRRGIKYIRTHLHYPISLDDVGEFVKINPKYFSRSFFNETGMKFTEFVQRERIKEACVLLKTTDMSCIEIANTLSFSSQSYFIKIFSDVMKTTPQKYRMEKGTSK